MATPKDRAPTATCQPRRALLSDPTIHLVAGRIEFVAHCGLLLLRVAPLGILFLVVGGALSPETDLGFWSALSVPYAITRVLLAVSHHG